MAHQLGEEAGRCKFCGNPTVWYNDRHSICQQISCPLHWIPQEWIKEIPLEDGRVKLELIGEKDAPNNDQRDAAE